LVLNDAWIFGYRAVHARIALSRRGSGAIAGNRKHVQLAIAPEGLFFLAPYDQRVRGKVAGFLSPWFQ
jgi:hypothetical protein